MRMNTRQRAALAVLAGTTLIVVGCSKPSRVRGGLFVDNATMNGPNISSYSLSSARGGGGGNGIEVTAFAAESRRFVATKHTLEMIAGESNLQKAWQAVIDYCGTISCEVLSSSITAKTDQTLPSGRASLRVEPADLKKLLSFVESQGRVAEHSTESEDKTGQVLDTEAKIKNLTTYRDSLRAMLSKSSVTVKDAIEIQGQLSEVQSKLDSETAGRKALANETEKVAVSISFRVEVPMNSSRGFRQIWNAIRDSGSILAESTAWLIMAVMTLLPWVIVIAPLLWILVRWMRRRKRPVEGRT